MNRTLHKLTYKSVQAANEPGRIYSDGGGLYLSVSRNGTKSWIYRYVINGHLREMGLGSIHTVNLAMAREAALQARRMRRQHLDPIEVKHEARAQAKIEQAKLMTFQQAAEQYVEMQQSSWTAVRHHNEWIGSLQRHIFPIIGNLPVQSIDTALVLRAIEKIWLIRHESAVRIRGRIESVLDWARSHGYREGENPARWRGHLENLLPKDIHRVEHFDALPYDNLPTFMQRLKQHPDAAARALSFTILTVARAGMIRRMQPSEFDFGARTWTVPAERMKARRSTRSDFRVPLSPQAIEVAQQLLATPIKHRGETTMLPLLKRMGLPKLTVHGFRSTFSDWVSEQTSTPAEIREMALAHTIGNRVEAAYRRGDLFEKRRELMEAWAHFCFPSAIW